MMQIERILCVDDNDVDHLFHRRRIAAHDAQIDVRTVAHGQEALNTLASGAFWPDLIFLDINMPVMGGLEFLASAHERYSVAVPPVVLTLTSEYQDADYEAASVYASVMGWLVKPLPRTWMTDVARMVREDDARGS